METEVRAMTLTEFLLARIAEDEAAARTVAAPVFERDRFSFRFDSAESDHSREDSAFVDRFCPARVLAECAAKRRIVEDFRGDYDMGVETPDQKFVLRVLALPYAEHPDFRPEWRP